MRMKRQVPDGIIMFVWFMIICFVDYIALTDGILVRRSLDDYPSAVCVDGTPASYYHSHPSSRGISKFVIFLNGGGYCPGIEDCKLRCYLAPQFCTTPTDPVRYQYGIMSDDPEVNPYFHDWHKVDVPYCTGDMYAGRRLEGPETENMAFAGGHVIESVITSLKESGIDSADEVLLTGSSAGGAGVVFNCDHVQKMLPEVRVSCVVDGAFVYPFVRPFTQGSSCQTIREILDIGTDLWNAPVIKLFPLNGWWNEIKARLFIGNALFDEFGFDIFCGDRDSDRNVTGWSHGVRGMVRHMLADRSDVGAFIPGCFSHMMLTNDVMFGQLRVGHGGRTYDETLNNWLKGKQNGSLAIDFCQSGFPCNSRCESIY